MPRSVRMSASTRSSAGAHLQHVGGVHDVLRRRAPVHVATGLAAHLHHLVHERQDRVADDVGLLPHVIEVDAVELRLACDRVGGLDRDHAAARLGAGERDLDLDVALDQRAVGQDLAHAFGAESVAEQDEVDDGAGHGVLTPVMRKARHTEIAADLAAAIADGRFPVGSLLPTEFELCGRYDASRYTVRLALGELHEQGLISRRKNVGTRVEAVRPTTGFTHSLASAEDLAQFGAKHTRVVRQVEEVVADLVLAKELGCAPGTRWLRVSSLRMDGGKKRLPIGWTDVYIDAAYADVANLVRESPGTLTSTLIEARYGRRIAKIEQDIGATTVPRKLAEELKADANSPALRIARRYLDAAEEPFEISVTLHPAGRFTFSMVLQRSRE
jgi:DNA-binding GntR family transcriptional regulator